MTEELRHGDWTAYLEFTVPTYYLHMARVCNSVVVVSVFHIELEISATRQLPFFLPFEGK